MKRPPPKDSGRGSTPPFGFRGVLNVKEALEDYEDLKDLRAAKAKEGNAKKISLSEAKKD